MSVSSADSKSDYFNFSNARFCSKTNQKHGFLGLNYLSKSHVNHRRR